MAKETVLITNPDGKPTKSKIKAYQYLKEKGIENTALIEKEGLFYYEADKDETPIIEKKGEVKFLPVTWETEIYDKNNQKTELVIPGTTVKGFINAKHPAGQNRSKSAFEICIENENFIMSVDLISKIFKVKEA